MESFIQISIPIISYSLLFILCFWINKKQSENLLSLKVKQGNWTLLHIRHAAGVVLMVFLPIIFLPAVPIGLLTWSESFDLIKMLVLILTGTILIILSVQEVGKIKITINSLDSWPASQILLHVMLRTSFLVCYEWFFRGVVLYSCIDVFGLFPAVFINLLLYALIHSFNGRKEFIGSIPFGLTLCAFTIWWQSLWPAIILHLVLSWTYEALLIIRIYSKHSKLVL